MAATKRSRSKAEVYYPSGPRAIAFELSETGWELLDSALSVRIRKFEEWIHEIKQLKDPDLIAKQLPWYSESLEELKAIQLELRNQIDRDYFAKKCAERNARLKSLNPQGEQCPQEPEPA